MTPDYLLVGHLTADLKPEGRVLGGTVSYAAAVARACGRLPAVLTSAAQDEPFVELLGSISDIKSVYARHTTTFENVYVNGGRVQTLHARAETLTSKDVPETWHTIPAVHLAPLVDEIAPDLFEAFPDSTIMLTPQGLMRQWDSAGRVRFRYWCDRDLLQNVHLVVFSKQDIQEMPEIEYEFAQSVGHVVVTDGANGGVHYDHGVATPYRAILANEVDPTGAGDVFATTLLISLLDTKNYTRSLKVAAHVAALTVEHDKVYVPTVDEIVEIMQMY
jgi:sugar/nucleoside kinase (ribokinase family)